jgi:hypothetical protein
MACAARAQIAAGDLGLHAVTVICSDLKAACTSMCAGGAVLPACSATQ